MRVFISMCVLISAFLSLSDSLMKGHQEARIGDAFRGGDERREMLQRRTWGDDMFLALC